MSNARDKANIPVLNFQSKGIDDNADATAITIDSSERVGILQTSPNSNLHVSSGGNTKVRFDGNLNTNTSTFLISHISSGDAGLHFNSNQLNMFSYGDIAFYPSTSNISGSYPNGEVMRIRNNGNVGIGTSAPTPPSAYNGLVINATYPVLKLTSATSGTGVSDGFTIRVNSADDAQLWHYEEKNMSFATNNAERMRITSSGIVGIGTSSPSSISNLHVADAYASEPMIRIETSDSGNKRLDLYVSGGHGYVTARQSAQNLNLDARSNLIFNSGSSAGTERMRIDGSTGNVGIGTTSPTEALDVSGSINLTDSLKIDGSINFEATASSPSSESIYKPAPYSIAVNTNSAEMARFVDSRLLINSTTNVSSEYLLIKNNYTRSGMTIKSNTTAAHHAIEFHNPNNQVGSINTSGSSVVYNTSSDYRLKENVSYDFDATSRLKQLKPARFNFIADANTTVDGFLAHEVSSVVPEAISGEKDAVDEDGNPKYQGIDQSKLVPLLVKTIQELEARITTLETNNP